MTRQGWTAADYAESYTRDLGLHLVPLPPGQKRPANENWGLSVISAPAAARDHYARHPTANIGVALGPSRVCSLDIDDLDAARVIFNEFGWDLDALTAQHATCQGQPPGMRVLFKAPDAPIAYHSLTWPKQGEPGRFTVFELRAVNDNQQRQDVLPPSIHPTTREPYVWLTDPQDVDGLHPPPDWLIALWTNWDALKPQLQDICPWAPRTPRAAPTRAPQQGDSVIDAYDRANSILEALTRYGYRQQGKRWLSPHSSTKLPGVVVWPDDNRCWIHHASDPLCSNETGRPVAPFDLFACYEHGGDQRAAAKAAAAQLGMNRNQQNSRAISKPTPEQVDPETGEIMPAPTNGNAPGPMVFGPLPDCTDKGRPLSTIENLQAICRRLDVTIRYNVISKEEEILIPGQSFSVDNRANASLAWLSSWCARLRMPTEKIGDFVTYIADQNLYNPVAEWITSKPWDGQSRLQDLCDTIDAANNALKCVLIKRWMISAVAAAFSPDGVSAHGVLTLQGDQYLGKTKWFKQLVPAHLGVLKDGMLLQPHDKDSVKQVCSFWLVELGELDATFRKSDIAALKSFITNKSDVLRRAYARKESHFARRTVFFASVNPRQFLHDTTGNRRYWTIEARHIDHSHGINMQQVWAEVLTLYQAGESYYLQPDEMAQLNELNEEFTVIDPIQERLHSRLDWDSDPITWRWKTATEVLIELGMDRPTSSDATRGALFIRAKNGGKSKRNNGASRLLVPPLVGLMTTW